MLADSIQCAGEWRGLEVAIKTLVVESKPHDKATTSVAREAAIATTLSHRNVVATYSHDIAGVSGHGGQELDIYRFYLIQEFCNGKTLRSAVARRSFAPERQPRRWRAIKQVLLDVAAGMEYVHSKGIVHGDLNPANVLLKVRAWCSITFACLSDLRACPGRQRLGL
jgi:serine/threonine protein kinase